MMIKIIGTAYEKADEIVICGPVPQEPAEWAEDDARRHNCDAMGCGAAHVLYRFRKPSPPTVEFLKFQAFLMAQLQTQLGIPSRLLSTADGGHPCPCVGAGSISQEEAR